MTSLNTVKYNPHINDEEIEIPMSVREFDMDKTLTCNEQIQKAVKNVIYSLRDIHPL